jgi:hypothetical protein
MFFLFISYAIAYVLIADSFHYLCAGDTKFDASQYAFFGNNVLEEVELGGLDDDDAGDAAFVGAGDEEYTHIYGRDTLEVKQMIDLNISYSRLVLMLATNNPQ